MNDFIDLKGVGNGSKKDENVQNLNYVKRKGNPFIHVGSCSFLKKILKNDYFNIEWS